MVFLYASPFCMHYTSPKGKKRLLKQVERVDYHAERLMIENLLSEFRQIDVKYKSAVASVSERNSIEKILKKGPKVIHCCINFMPEMRYSMDDAKRMNYLIFQNEFMVSEYISQIKLKELITRYYNPASKMLQLVFIPNVEPLESETIANIWLDCGVQHVICTLDRPGHPNPYLLKRFTQCYYEAVFKTGLTLCEAFYHSIKYLIKTDKLLSVDDVDKYFICYSNHKDDTKCFHYSNSTFHPESTWRNHTKQLKYKIIPP
jgi:hypothetical protein